MGVDEDGTLGMAHNVVVVEKLDWAYCVAGLHLKVLRGTLQLQQDIWKLD